MRLSSQLTTTLSLYGLHFLMCVCVCVSVFQGVENAVCVLRNLSYQLYSEMPPSALIRLEGPSRAEDSGKGEAIGCFTPQSKKANNVRARGAFLSPF